MLDALFALIAGLFAALFGLGIALTALATLLAMALFPLLPLLLLLWILHRLGLIQGCLASLAVLFAGLVLLLALAYFIWSPSVGEMQSWLEEHRELVEACRAKNGALSFELQDGHPRFTCILPKQRDF